MYLLKHVKTGPGTFRLGDKPHTENAHSKVRTRENTLTSVVQVQALETNDTNAPVLPEKRTPYGGKREFASIYIRKYVNNGPSAFRLKRAPQTENANSEVRTRENTLNAAVRVEALGTNDTKAPVLPGKEAHTAKTQIRKYILTKTR